MRSLTRRRLAVVLALSVIFSTQILAQPSIFGHWSLEQILAGWLDYFTEVALTAFAMLIAFVMLENSTRREGLSRTVALALTLPVAAACGYAIAVLLVHPPGFMPGPTQFVGDALHLATIGMAIALIHSLRERELAVAASTRKADVAQQALAGQMMQARLRLMEAQIEPHFLFNTIANAQRLLETGSASGIQLLDNLKVYLRAALPQMRESQSTVGREAEFARAYLEIIQARMAERLRFAIDVPAELQDHPLPPMMLITLVENAIKHGIEPLPDGGFIMVRAGRGERAIHVEVLDTGAGLSAGASGPGVGLANIRARLAALFGSGARLTLGANQPGGVIARIEFCA